MGTLSLLVSALCLTLVTLAPLQGLAEAAPKPPITAKLSLDKKVYLPGEPVLVTLELEHSKDREVYARQGFTARDFRLMLVFTDEQGRVKTTTVGISEPRPEPLAPKRIIRNGKSEHIHLVEEVAQDWRWERTFDARAIYPLEQPGRYRVRAEIPVNTYKKNDIVSPAPPQDQEEPPQPVYALIKDNDPWQLKSNKETFSLVGDEDGDGYWYPQDHPSSPRGAPDCDDADLSVHPEAYEVEGNGKDDDCNPGTPDRAMVLSGTLNIEAKRGVGGVKEPVAALPVRIYDTSPRSCAGRFGASKKHFEKVWKSCRTVEPGTVMTDSSGEGSVSLAPGRYLVIGMHDPDGTYDSGDETYRGTVKAFRGGVATVRLAFR